MTMKRRSLAPLCKRSSQATEDCRMFATVTVVTDNGQIVVREQWNHPYKEGSSLFRFHISDIVQSLQHSGCL